MILPQGTGIVNFPAFLASHVSRQRAPLARTGPLINKGVISAPGWVCRAQARATLREWRQEEGAPNKAPIWSPQCHLPRNWQGNCCEKEPLAWSEPKFLPKNENGLSEGPLQSAISCEAGAFGTVSLRAWVCLDAEGLLGRRDTARRLAGAQSSGQGWPTDSLCGPGQGLYISGPLLPVCKLKEARLSLIKI